MGKIDELLTAREPFPHVGVEAVEWAAALHVLAESPLVNDKRVLFCRTRDEGRLLLVQTGETKGACYGSGEWVLMERQAEGWVVAEVIWWRS